MTFIPNEPVAARSRMHWAAEYDTVLSLLAGMAEGQGKTLYGGDHGVGGAKIDADCNCHHRLLSTIVKAQP